MSSYITIPTILDKLESGTATADDVLLALNVRASMKQTMKDIDARFVAGAIEWIKANGELQSGDVRYYVGSDKKTVCNDQGETLRALLEAGGPDAVTKCLASGAFKHGACKEPLGDQWDKHFTVKVEDDLKEGKPAKLQTVNERFLPAST